MKLLEDRSFLAQLIIRNLCKRNMTMKQLAKDIGIGYLSLQKLLSGEIKKPSFLVIFSIHQLLNIPIDDLADAIKKDNGR